MQRTQGAFVGNMSAGCGIVAVSCSGVGIVDPNTPCAELNSVWNGWLLLPSYSSIPPRSMYALPGTLVFCSVSSANF
ncbi:MAG: hypothetical protein ACJ8F1_20345 [Polyangia bacterium]